MQKLFIFVVTIPFLAIASNKETSNQPFLESIQNFLFCNNLPKELKQSVQQLYKIELYLLKKETRRNKTFFIESITRISEKAVLMSQSIKKQHQEFLVNFQNDFPEDEIFKESRYKIKEKKTKRIHEHKKPLLKQMKSKIVEIYRDDHDNEWDVSIHESHSNQNTYNAKRSKIDWL